MATLEEIFDADEMWENTRPSLLSNLGDPEIRQALLAPLQQAGFTDFALLSTAGTSSFFLAPEGNDQIVFRITCEEAVRHNSIPFFLAGPTISEWMHPDEEEAKKKLRVEVLLRAKQDIDYDYDRIQESGPGDREYLFKEMKRAGWRVDFLGGDDIIFITLRDGNGRTKTVPVFSDPSDFEYYMKTALPAGALNTDDTLNTSVINRCSSDYITLQDQAAAYNAAREADPRLKKLLPNPVEFPPTTVIAQTPEAGRVV